MKGNLNTDTKRENILWGQADNTGRHVTMETETEIMCLTSKGTAKAAGKHQKLEEKHGTASSQSLQKKLIHQNWCQNFSLQNCMREYISVIVSHPVCVTLFWQPWETNVLIKSLLVILHTVKNFCLKTLFLCSENLFWFSRGRHGISLQYSCLENPLDRGAWWAMVHRVAKCQTTEVT